MEFLAIIELDPLSRGLALQKAFEKVSVIQYSRFHCDGTPSVFFVMTSFTVTHAPSRAFTNEQGR